MLATPAGQSRLVKITKQNIKLKLWTPNALSTEDDKNNF